MTATFKAGENLFPPLPAPVLCPICGADLTKDPHRPPCKNVKE